MEGPKANQGGEPRRGAWARLLELFLGNPLVVYLLVGFLMLAGFSVQPFDWQPFDVPRHRVAVDAIPDVGENQQIVFTRWEGRSPRDIEDQVTYPLTTHLLGLPGVKTVRSSSMLGFSSIYVIFEEGIDVYWARSRILEKLSALPPETLPSGANPALGPDATALGQVFWYTLEGRNAEGEPTGGWDLHELRAVQDWTVRYGLQSVEGVAEVASIGGYQMEYQVDVDPEALAAHEVEIGEVARAVRGANLDVGARTMEINRVEYLIRGVGLVKGVEDLEEAVIVAREGRPVRVRDVGRVVMGPQARRGALDYAGAEAVGGVVVARHGANPVEVVEGIKAKLGELSPGLPRRTLEDGTLSQVEVVPFYDRTEIVEATLATLSEALVQQMLVTIIVVIFLLGHLRSAAVIGLLLPLSVLVTFALMKLAGVSANVMSLAGIAIAIGTMVDMGIVLVENIVARLREAPDGSDRLGVVRDAASEVAPAVFTSVMTTVVSFLPVFALTGSEGKLFRPLAYTKTFALLVAFGLAVVALPTLARLLLDKARRGGASRSWWRSAVRAVVEGHLLRDGLLIWLGGALIVFGRPLLGAVVVAVGALRVVGAWRGGQLGVVVGWVENAAVAAVVTWVLTRAWLPLGFEAPQWQNLLFVSGLTYGLLLFFWGFIRVYEPLLEWTLDNKALFLLIPGLLMAVGVTAWRGFEEVSGWMPNAVQESARGEALAEIFPGFGEEFMPEFDEGEFLYMPTTMPHASFGESLDQLKLLDARIARVPEVESVVGKLGRVDSALDPAPVSMFETMIAYKPEWAFNEEGERVRQWRDHIESPDDIWDEIVEVAAQPGLTSAPKLMPISTRIVMLQSGMRAPMGVQIQGPDQETIEAVGLRMEELLKEVPGVKAQTVAAERVVGKPYLEIEIDREEIGRYGLSVSDVQETISIALGGRVLTQTVEGRERYPVRVRYMREERDSPEALSRLLVPTQDGTQVPLGQLATLRYVRGPQVIKSENTFPMTYVTFGKESEVSEVAVVEEAEGALRAAIASEEFELPDGVSYRFVGSYQNQQRSEETLGILIPVSLAIIFLLLYVQFGRGSTAGIIFTGVAVAFSGGFILIWLYNQPWFMDFEVFGRGMRDLFGVGAVNMSVAVWVGFIALLGIATDDGVVMATYLRQRFEAAPASSVAQVRRRVVEAGLRRVRPCLMTTATTLLALLPVVTSQGRGADVMVPMAIPALGGMAIELVTLFVVPVLYCLREEWRLGTSEKKW